MAFPKLADPLICTFPHISPLLFEFEISRIRPKRIKNVTKNSLFHIFQHICPAYPDQKIYPETCLPKANKSITLSKAIESIICLYHQIFDRNVSDWLCDDSHSTCSGYQQYYFLSFRLSLVTDFSSYLHCPFHTCPFAVESGIFL